MTSAFSERLTSLDQHGFNDLALELFQKHLKYNPVYAEFVRFLGKDTTKVRECHEIPFMPVDMFKSARVLLSGLTEERIFESSSTTGKGLSRHYLPDLAHYGEIIHETFVRTFGEPADYAIYGLLPGYIERQNSSLIYMVQHLMTLSGYVGGFYTYQLDKLNMALQKAPKERKILLFGVTWALLDYASTKPVLPPDTMVIETGGMKGRHTEIIRAELHEQLKSGFGIENICTEYGMTELQSMAYSLKDGLLKLPPWIRIYIMDKNDPFQILPPGQSGKICIIDLANHQTCPFIATADLGIEHPDGSIEILGRTDYSEMRGCSLMAI
jgi:hypothetical protein